MIWTRPCRTPKDIVMQEQYSNVTRVMSTPSTYMSYFRIHGFGTVSSLLCGQECVQDKAVVMVYPCQLTGSFRLRATKQHINEEQGEVGRGRTWVACKFLSILMSSLSPPIDEFSLKCIYRSKPTSRKWWLLVLRGREIRFKSRKFNI